MDFYQVNLAILVVANVSSFIYHHRSQIHKQRRCGVPRDEHSEAVATKFQRKFLFVYALVVAADWLQVCEDSFSLRAVLILTRPTA